MLVIGLAAVVLLVEAADSPSVSFVNAAILALLGITAIILLRDRQGRARVGEIASFVEDLRSDRPYQVQSEVNRWEIDDQGGRAATFTKTQRLVFTRNEVCTLEHWCGGTGEVDLCQADWRIDESGPWIGATTIHDFGMDGGRNYIFSLDTERSRGDTLHWRVTRKLSERFLGSRESVSLKLQAPTHRPRLQVVWPKDREPHNVEIRHDGGAGRKLAVRHQGDGRAYVDEQLAVGTANTLAKIEWTW
jgi:hypothetical protein